MNYRFKILSARFCASLGHNLVIIRPASLLTLLPALLGNVVLAQHVARLLHELAHGGILLAVVMAGAVVVIGFAAAIARVAAAVACTGSGVGL